MLGDSRERLLVPLNAVLLAMLFFDKCGSTECDDEVSEIPIMVSVIIPTTSQRAKFHAGILRCFEAQTFARKELVILDEGPAPSNVFFEKPNVRYSLIDPKLNMPLGHKRNELVRLARGDVIAHFDDDDFYAANYIEEMVKALKEKNVSLVKLSGFYVYLSQSKMLGYWDQTRDSPFLPQHLRGDQQIFPIDKASLFFSRFNGLHIKPVAFGPQPWDFGFTLLYRKELHRRVGGFNSSMFLGEDSDFTQRINALGDPSLAAHIQDSAAIALKMMHPKTSSNALSQFLLPPWFLRRLFGEEIQKYTDVMDSE